MNDIYNYLARSFLKEIIENRETCKHFINYEIYDALPQSLKDTYIEQFPCPDFCFNPAFTKSSVLCRANHKDNPSVCTCDCTEHYALTLEKFSKRFTERAFNKKDTDD